jgi:hypothetical protein
MAELTTVASCVLMDGQCEGVAISVFMPSTLLWLPTEVNYGKY